MHRLRPLAFCFLRLFVVLSALPSPQKEFFTLRVDLITHAVATDTQMQSILSHGTLCDTARLVNEQVSGCGVTVQCVCSRWCSIICLNHAYACLPTQQGEEAYFHFGSIYP